jgi:hypothetical protein
VVVEVEDLDIGEDDEVDGIVVVEVAEVVVHVVTEKVEIRGEVEDREVINRVCVGLLIALLLYRLVAWLRKTPRVGCF